MDNIREKLDSFGLELVFSANGRLGLKDLKTAIEDVHLNSWKPVTFDYLITEKASLQIANFREFHRAFQLPQKYQALDDIFFSKLTIEYNDDKELLLYFNRSYHILGHHLQQLARSEPEKLLLPNRKWALQYAFNPEQAYKEYSWDQVDLAKELKEEPVLKEAMKIFGNQMEELSKELLKEIIKESYQES